ncbi:DUF4444 domain-containing protein [Shimia sp. R11_0]|uniref:biotin/lipoate--protein ligase family protein n=1 Tax=Shimia sp. R11_0 TaxID=2821096 RepID=UPI001ADB4C95|nr:biotin/lipoate--protein ligase family protein [Shimia sp. R11_0]MBO9476359.1 DUF4444 domain-containing protein [Shimia sp. R11_0]
MSNTVHFPPLFHGMALTGTADPFAKAQAQAIMGCDAGLVVYNLAADQIRAAMVFAPEVPLRAAMPVLISCAIGFQNALGALAPPEVGVHLEWPGTIRVNGARCGRLRIAASHQDPAAEPDWIVVGLELPLVPANADTPGITPDDTALYEEGCVDIRTDDLLSAWVRHSLVWINRMEEEGLKPLATEWRGLAHDLGEEVNWPLSDPPETGTFLGTDEHFGALLRSGETTRLLPLTHLLEGTT